MEKFSLLNCVNKKNFTQTIVMTGQSRWKIQAKNEPVQSIVRNVKLSFKWPLLNDAFRLNLDGLRYGFWFFFVTLLWSVIHLLLICIELLNVTCNALKYCGNILVCASTKPHHHRHRVHSLEHQFPEQQNGLFYGKQLNSKNVVFKLRITERWSGKKRNGRIKK